jgi:hypothetical protein
LLIVLDEGAVDLKLGDEFVAYAREQAIARKTELPGPHLLFRQNIHEK